MIGRDELRARLVLRARTSHEAPTPSITRLSHARDAWAVRHDCMVRGRLVGAVRRRCVGWASRPLEAAAQAPPPSSRQPGTTPPTDAMDASPAPLPASTSPTTPHAVKAAPTTWKELSRQTTASAWKCSPTTTETHATPASGASSTRPRTCKPPNSATTSTASTIRGRGRRRTPGSGAGLRCAARRSSCTPTKRSAAATRSPYGHGTAARRRRPGRARG